MSGAPALYLTPVPVAAAAGLTWTVPDLPTYAELSGASYDHGSSSYTANGGTAAPTASHGQPDAGLDSGGAVSADLGVTLADQAFFVAELDVDDIPRGGLEPSASTSGSSTPTASKPARASTPGWSASRVVPIGLWQVSSGQTR